jgi:hypothetical protein
MSIGIAGRSGRGGIRVRLVVAADRDSRRSAQIRYAAWCIGVAAVVGIVLRPSVPWLYLWAAMLTFGFAKLPAELRDAWRRMRERRERVPR